MRRRGRRAERRFDPNDYWASRPYCSICHARKTRSGNVCYECRKSGATAPTPTKEEQHATSPLNANSSQTCATSAAKPTIPASSPTNQQSKPGFGVGAFVAIGACVVIAAIAWGTSNQTPPSRPSPERPRGSYASDVHVSGHYRSDGTYVPPHYRTRQNHVFEDNYSTKGNRNPYTGKEGTRRTSP